MLEPSARYSAGGVGGGGGGAGQTLQIDTHHSGLETAVDLSRKTEATGGDLDADQEDSEDDAPLDLKVGVFNDAKTLRKEDRPYLLFEISDPTKNG